MRIDVCMCVYVWTTFVWTTFDYQQNADGIGTMIRGEIYVAMVLAGRHARINGEAWPIRLGVDTTMAERDEHRFDARQCETNAVG